MFCQGKSYSVPTNSISITNPTDGTVVSAADESTRYNEITTKYGAHSHTDILTDFTDNTLTIGDGTAGNKNYAVDTDNAGNPTLRFSTTARSWQVSTESGLFPGRLTVSGIVDLDQDTGVFVERTSDLDRVEIKIEETFTTVFGDGTNEELSLFTNAGTNYGLSLQQNGILASGKQALYIYSDAAQTTSDFIFFEVDNSSSTGSVLILQNDGTGDGIQMNQNGNGEAIIVGNAGTNYGIHIAQAGTLASNKHALFITSDVTQDTEALVHFVQDDASTSKEALEITYDGDGNSILADGASLNNAGVWTDRVSTHAEKYGTTEVTDFSSYITKLKDLKLFSYQKKREVYGAKKDILSEEGEELTEKDKKVKKEERAVYANGKKYRIKGNKKYEVTGREYSDTKKKPSARTYVGYILDDASTPEELIARNNKDDSISGISSADGVNFLLGVVKEQQKLIEDLEARVVTLENYH